MVCGPSSLLAEVSRASRTGHGSKRIDTGSPSLRGPLNPCALRLDLEDGFDALRPKFGIAHTAEPAGRGYLNSARSFKSGDFGGHSILEARPFAPESQP